MQKRWNKGSIDLLELKGYCLPSKNGKRWVTKK